MKAGALIATVISVALLTASNPVMSKTLTPEDMGVHTGKNQLSVYEFVPKSRVYFANLMQMESVTNGESGKSGLIEGLPKATSNPGEAIGLPLSVPANPGKSLGMPEHVPLLDPPLDTPAFYNGLVNAPTMMPAVVPSHTLPGSGFGQDQVVVPVPAAAWLFGSGLIVLLGRACYRRQ